MPRTTPLTSTLARALTGRGKAAAAVVGAAAALAGAGTASAATVASTPHASVHAAPAALAKRGGGVLATPAAASLTSGVDRPTRAAPPAAKPAAPAAILGIC